MIGSLHSGLYVHRFIDLSHDYAIVRRTTSTDICIMKVGKIKNELPVTFENRYPYQKHNQLKK